MTRNRLGLRLSDAITAPVLLRLAGAAALLGGLMRLAANAAPRYLDPVGVQATYLSVDLLLLTGLIGWFARRATRLGWTGVIGLAMALVGIALVRSQAAFAPAVPSTTLYSLGGALWGLAMAALGARAVLARAGGVIAPALWIAAVLIGVAGPWVLPAPMVSLLAAAAFSAGYIVAGVELLRTKANDLR